MGMAKSTEARIKINQVNINQVMPAGKKVEVDDGNEKNTNETSGKNDTTVSTTGETKPNDSAKKASEKSFSPSARLAKNVEKVKTRVNSTTVNSNSAYRN